MQFKKIIPPHYLRPYVRHFWLLDVRWEDIPSSHLLFPFGAFELIFNLVGAPEMKIEGSDKIVLQPACLYPGQFTSPFTINYTSPFKSVGISLQPWAGNILLDSPAQQFTDRIIDVTDVNKSFRLHEQLPECSSEAEIIAHLEKFVGERISLRQNDIVSFVIADAILKNPSTVGYKDMISGIGLSRRRIEQRFLESTGLSIGMFHRKARFQNAVAMLRSPDGLSLTHIGLQAGYYDQPHFIREFKSFSGASPKEFLTQQYGLDYDIACLMMEA